MGARVTQETIEALVPADPNARVTQDAVEVLESVSGTQGRVTSESVELLTEPEADLRVTAASPEVIYTTDADVQVTASAVEVLRPNIEEYTRPLTDNAPVVLDTAFAIPGRSVIDSVAVADRLGVGYDPAVLAQSGLLAYWVMGGSGSLTDAKSGKVLTPNGTPSAGQTDPFGGTSAVTLNGSSYYSLGSHGFPTGDAPRSIELWVKTISTSTFPVAGWGAENDRQLWFIEYNRGASGNLGALIWADDYGIAAGVSDGLWKHVVVTYDGTNTRLYVNGVLKNTRNQDPLSTAAGTFYVNHRPTSGGGQITTSRLAVYNLALDQTAISNHYALATAVTAPVTATAVSAHPRTAGDAVATPSEALVSVRGVPRTITDTLGVTDAISSRTARPFIRSFIQGALGSGSFTRPFDVLGTAISGQFTRLFDISGRTAGAFSRPFDMDGAIAGTFTRPFDLIAEVANPPSGITPPPSDWTGTVLTADAAAGDTTITVNDATLVTDGTLISIGGEYRTVVSTTATTIAFDVVLGGSYPAGTAVTAVSDFQPDAMWVLDKAGHVVGALRHYTVTAARRWLINGVGDMSFYVPRNSPDTALLRGDRLVCIESSLGLPVWAGTMIGLKWTDGRVDVTCPDVFNLLTKLPVTYDAGENDVPAASIISAVIDLANQQKAAAGDLTFEVQTSGTNLLYGGIKVTDTDPLEVINEMVRRSDIEFMYSAAMASGTLVVTILVADRFETAGTGAYFDGPGGNVVSQPLYTEDYGTAYNAVKLTGIGGQIADCLPDWASWAANDLVPEVTVERDPGDLRRRVTLELNAEFGFSQTAIDALCNEIEAYLQNLYLTFLYAWHDQYGKPFHPGWSYEGPPSEYEQYLTTGLGWRTSRNLILYQNEAASMVMMSTGEGQILIVTYNRITGVKKVFRTWFSELPGTQMVYTAHVHGYSFIYHSSGGVITERRRPAFDHSSAIVSYNTTTMLWPQEVTDPNTGKTSIHNTYLTLRRIISLTEQGAVTEGDWMGMEPAVGPTDGVYDAYGDPVFVRPVVGDAPYKTFTWEPAPGGVSEYEVITHVFDFERNRINQWDPRRDGVGAYFNAPSVWRNAPSTKARWHRVPWGVGGERTTNLLQGINATQTQMYVESAWDFMSQPLPFVVTIGLVPGNEDVKVTKIEGTLWTIVRAQNGTTAILHEIGEPVTMSNADVQFVVPNLDLSWPEGEAWANKILDRLQRPTQALSFRVVNRGDIWRASTLGSTRPADITTEGSMAGVHGTVRVLGIAVDEAAGTLEVLTEWQ